MVESGTEQVMCNGRNVVGRRRNRRNTRKHGRRTPKTAPQDGQKDRPDGEGCKPPTVSELLTEILAWEEYLSSKEASRAIRNLERLKVLLFD